jgi:hypothetical protein
MPRSTVLVLVAVLLLGGRPPDAPAGPSEGFSLGVLRQDGLLLPFASFDGRKWQNTWPLPPRRVDVPIQLADVDRKWWPDRQPLLDWTLWTPDGDAQPLRVIAPAWTPVQCEGAVALRTSWPIAGPLPPLTEQPYPKVGLATTGSGRVEPVTIVDNRSVEWQRLADQIPEPMNEAEDAAVSHEVSYGWSHPASASRRHAMPVTLEAAYRAPFVVPGSFVYYVEATRRYLAPGWTQDPSCDLVTFAGGWLAIDRAGNVSSEVQAMVTDCDRSFVQVMLPLGVLRFPERILWVGQWSGWSVEEYGVVELNPPLDDRTLIETRAGSCR